MTRRTFLPALGASAAAATAVTPPKERRLKQSVTAGVFRGSQMTLDDMCREAAKLGVYGFDLIGPEDWPMLKKYGLTPTMYHRGREAPFPTAEPQRESRSDRKKPA